jgi:hypothetical protein
VSFKATLKRAQPAGAAALLAVLQNLFEVNLSVFIKLLAPRSVKEKNAA